MIFSLFIVALVGACAFALLLGLYIKKKNIDIWLKAYLVRLFNHPKADRYPIDIMFLFVDHFELNNNPDRLEAWDQRYPELARKHRDHDNQHPKHTFFYAIDLMYEHELEQLQHLVTDGYGEFELHWHHDHDTAESFVTKLRAGLEKLQKYGYMKPYHDGQGACFGFIHGNWSLANSRGAEFCGVDNEIELLQAEGCYGDFTFPAFTQVAQPPFVSNIYYSRNGDQAKSYFAGREASVGVSPQDDEFMIFQGPLTINWKDWRYKWHPAIEDGDINYKANHADPRRIEAWIRQAIHVRGRPEWQFVKVFCHGAQDHAAVVSDETDRMFDYLEAKYNDGEKYRLHYVTAREAFNIVRAAEDGKSGNPGDFRDYVIPHPLER